MAKFSGTATKTRPPQGPTRTVGPAVTHERGYGFEKDPKTALYTLAVVNMVSETTFYESATDRDDRFCSLVAQVTAEDPQWVQGFIPWLRNTANMRSAPLVAALEYARAGGPNARGVIDSALQRADEPAEALGYWLAKYGRKLPMAVKRGIADAAVRLYNQYSAIKYDTVRRGIRMADVIELCHPNPARVRGIDEDAMNEEIDRRLGELGDHRTAADVLDVRTDVARQFEEGRIERIARQSELFCHLLNRRHGSFEPTPQNLADLGGRGLSRLAAAYHIDTLPTEQRRGFLAENGPEVLDDAGYTWERLSGWLPGGMDAKAWEAIIPAMGYMGLLRNLRNFEQAGVDKDVLRLVSERIASPEAVAQSRQFPYRFLSAYLNSGSTYFAPALETALELSLRNVPVFPGTTLVLVDTSASMSSAVSAHSAIRRSDVAALFGIAVASNSKVDLAVYATGHKRLNQRPFSALRAIEMIHNEIGSVGHGTQTWPSVLAEYSGQDRIVVFTDMQDFPSDAGCTLPDVPIYVWDLGGYNATNIDLMQPNRYCFGGFTDAAFRLISLLEAGSDVGWPWED